MKSYFTFLSRNKLYTIIQLFGLSVTLGVVILLASYARTEFSVSAKKVTDEPVYALGSSDYIGMTLGTPKAFFPSVPEIKDWTAISSKFNGYANVGDDFYQVNLFAVSPNFFQFFDYKLEGCTREEVLTDDEQMILSESFARKVFGTENPVGKTIRLENKDFHVVGIMEDFGNKDVFHPADMFVSVKYLDGKVQEMDNFGAFIPLVHLTEGSSPETVADKLLDKYKAYWDYYGDKDDETTFLKGSELYDLDDIYLGQTASDTFRSGDADLVEILLIVALILLVSATFNYINLTLAQAGKRAKEMATRRLLGESSTRVTLRYIRESFFMTACCFLLGCLIAYLALPLFNDVLHADISFSPDAVSFVFAILALVVVSVICGLVPALLAARFNMLDVLKGSFRYQNKLVLSRIFIGLQCIISTILLAVSITTYIQTDYLVNMPTGYNTKDLMQVLTARISYDSEKRDIVRKRLEALPEVEKIGVLGNSSPINCGYNGVHNEGEQTNSSSLWLSRMDSVAFQLFGFKIKEKFSDPLPGQVWLTSSGKEYYQLSQDHPGVGGSSEKPDYVSCGILEDFRMGTAIRQPEENSYNAIQYIEPDAPWSSYLLVKTHGDHDVILNKVRAICSQAAKEITGVPMDLKIEYLDDVLYDGLRKKLDFMKLIIGFMLVSLLISGMGLFGMSVYYSDQQRKSIALHRIMGSDISQAVVNLSRPFLITSAVAIVIAIPISIKLMEYYLDGFCYRIDFPWWILGVTALLVVFITMICVLSQIIHRAMANPVEAIKAE
ncbi:MAG: ABC transporter permease [Bacteroidaceae bacterium]|nr:ABC transporter permease [Bacteroidaceae bacterium]